MIKTFCRSCKDFQEHNYRKYPSCNRCRTMGNPAVVAGFIAINIFAFIYAIWRLWQGGGW